MEKNSMYRYFRWLTGKVADQYLKGLLSKSLAKEVRKFYKSLDQSLNWDELTKEDLISLGFVLWHEAELSDLWLIPGWLYPIIPEGLKVQTTDYHTYNFDPSILPYKPDQGYLNFGILVSKNFKK